MKIVRIVTFALMFATLVFAAVGPMVTAHADATDYGDNPGLPHASPSGTYHGAFQYYEGTRADWIPGAAQDGGIGDTTGPANSAGAPWGAQNP